MPARGPEYLTSGEAFIVTILQGQLLVTSSRLAYFMLVPRYHDGDGRTKGRARSIDLSTWRTMTASNCTLYPPL